MSIESPLDKKTDPLFKDHEALPNPAFDETEEYLQTRKEIESAGYSWRTSSGNELAPLSRDINFIFTRQPSPGDIETAKKEGRTIIPFDSTDLPNSEDLPTFIIVENGAHIEEDIEKAREIITGWDSSDGFLIEEE